MVVFGALSIFTAVSFVVNEAFVRHDVLSILIRLADLGGGRRQMLLAAIYFMHLIVGLGKSFYYFIFPTFILGTMFMIVLLPDIVLSKLTRFESSKVAVQPSGKSNVRQAFCSSP